MRITRRGLGAGAAALALICALPAGAETPAQVRIGFQKTNLPVVAQREGAIEAALAPQGTEVVWVEFQAGPPLVEALNAGAIDLGWTGDAPPIFGQAAGSAITYVAALPPNGQGEAIVAKKGSGVETLADLKGRAVAVGKGTSAHNLLAAALETQGLTLDDVEVRYLPPADAAAAFAADKVEAWAVWDPFLAIAETRYDPVVLARGSEILDVNTFFLGNAAFVEANPATVTEVLGGLEKAAAWAAAHRPEVAQALHEVTGVPIAAQTLAADRAEFGVFHLTDAIVARQQETADRFFRLGLIPKRIDISDAVWSGGRS